MDYIYKGKGQMIAAEIINNIHNIIDIYNIKIYALWD